MTNTTYIQGRWNLKGLRKRPQAIAWSNNYGSLDGNGLLSPDGTEYEDFIILSDHNRSQIDISNTRIENKQRTIGGSMRSYYTADKKSYSTSWLQLPSRAFSDDPEFNASGLKTVSLTDYTVDGGAGGVDIVKWYEDHTGSFYMFLAYDRYDKFITNEYSRLSQYNDVVEVMITSLTHSIVRRGGSTHDFWDINVSLEEV
jgi:hypothetical protein